MQHQCIITVFLQTIFGILSGAHLGRSLLQQAFRAALDNV